MATRRSNGSGSISRRKDGRLDVSLYMVTASGVRKRIHRYAKTPQQARTILAELQAKADAGIAVSDQLWKVAGYLDYWMQNVAMNNLRPRTILGYQGIIKKYLKPGIGGRSLERLSVPELQLFLNQLIAGGHSVRTVQAVRTVLSAALTQAMREELVTRNVARVVKLPAWRRKDIQPWSAEQASRFLAVAADHRLYPAFLLLAIYGMRRGEVAGLRWIDVDSDAQVIHVRQQLQRIGPHLEMGDVKTRAGRRNLPLLTVVAKVLAEHKDLQIRQRDDQTDPRTDLVFVSETGQPIEPGNIGRTFHILRQRAGLPRIKLHDLRHTAATLLKNLGVQPRDAQLILGHASIVTTQQIYQHGDLTIQLQGLQSIQKLLIQSDEEPGVRGYCRQKSTSSHLFAAQFTTFLFGGPGETRTHDTLLKSLIYLGGDPELTHVIQVLRASLRSRMLGSAAVKHSRQSLSPEQGMIQSELLETYRSISAIERTLSNCRRRAANQKRRGGGE